MYRLMKDYMERRVTSPAWGPTPPCKQALRPFGIRLLIMCWIECLLGRRRGGGGGGGGGFGQEGKPVSRRLQTPPF